MHKGKITSPSAVGYAFLVETSNAIGLLSFQGTFLDPVQLAVNQHPQVLFCHTTSPLLQAYITGWICYNPGKHLALSLVEYHGSGCSSLVLCRAFLLSDKLTLLPNVGSSVNLVWVQVIPSSRSVARKLKLAPVLSCGEYVMGTYESIAQLKDTNNSSINLIMLRIILTKH